MLNPYQAAVKLMNYRDLKKLTFVQKISHYFIDYDFIPMLV